MRSMLSSLTSRTDDVSEINKKDVSEINKKLSLIELTKKFSATYKFFNKDLNKFELFLRKGVYPYEYMDSWERFKETSLPIKNIFMVNQIKKVLLMKNMLMVKKYGKYLK